MLCARDCDLFKEPRSCTERDKAVNQIMIIHTVIVDVIGMLGTRWPRFKYRCFLASQGYGMFYPEG